MVDSNETLLALDAEIREVRKLVPPNSATPSDSGVLAYLASLLHRRYSRTGAAADLDEAVMLFRRALDGAIDTADSAQKIVHQSNLMAALYKRYTYLGQSADLDEAAALASQTAQLAPSGPERAAYLSNYAAVLYARFSSSGAQEDLDAAIEVLTEALQDSAQDDGSRAAQLSNLAIALRERYAYRGAPRDLQSAVQAASEAVSATSTTDPERPGRLVVLGSILLEVNARSGDRVELDRAIDLIRAATLDEWTSVDLQSHLIALGYALTRRFDANGAVEDLENAISAHRRVIALTSTDDPRLADRLASVSAVLGRKFDAIGDVADLTEAIEHSRREVALRAFNQKYHEAVFRLGELLLRRANSPGAEPSDVTNSFDILSSVAADGTADTSIRTLAARIAGGIAASRSDWQGALNLYQATMQSVGGSNKLAVRSNLAHVWSELASDAAASAISAGDLDRALTLFEAGRAVLLSTRYEIRTASSDLRRILPGLADRLNEARVRYETGQLDDREWDQLVTEVRTVSDFEDFLRPVRPVRNIDLDRDQLIIAVNVSRHRCDALIATRGELVGVPLPALTARTCAEWVDKYISDVLAEGSGNGTELEKQRRSEGTLSSILHWLQMQVLTPINRLLAELDISAVDRPQVFWALSGPLTILPIHAATLNPSRSEISGPLDRAVSSYVPSLTYLVRHTGQETASKAAHERPLVVAVSDVPTAGSLTSFSAELAAVRGAFASADILSGRNADVQDVVSQMPEHSLLHFAGHGRWSPSDAMSSGLLLEDGLLRAGDMLLMDLPQLKLAVLSASCTAVGSVTQPNEIIHPASALLTAGVKNVVGTLLSVRDNDAAEFFSEFYRNLTAGGWSRGSQQIARAVSDAGRSLSHKYPETPTAWAGFVHFGGR